ncbi:hypothetical protein GC194_15470, partial [bacterium]|nr:hypothetical protein [bacterium]
MSVKTLAARYFAKFISQKLAKESQAGSELQQKLLLKLVQRAQHTRFGRDHHFQQISDYDTFQKAVPIGDYETLKPYIERAINGEADVLWPGKPLYFAKTSGTTSGTKYIPITPQSIGNHIQSARNMLLSYVNQKNDASLLEGKLIFLQGSPVLQKKNGINIGRLSGIVAHHVPGYLQKNRLPDWETNCMEDWEQKVDAIVDQTLKHDMRLISGIPPWVQMYFDKLMEKTGKAVGELFPNFNLLVHGGVNFAPYKAKLLQSIGRDVDILETYPASEGFIAFQD